MGSGQDGEAGRGSGPDRAWRPTDAGGGPGRKASSSSSIPPGSREAEAAAAPFAGGAVARSGGGGRGRPRARTHGLDLLLWGELQAGHGGAWSAPVGETAG